MRGASTDDAATAVSPRAWGILVGLFCLSAGFIAYVITPATVLPVFAADFGVDKPAASAAISAVFLAWAALQIPAGFLMDRHDNRRLLAVGTVVYLVAATATLAVDGYTAFLAARLVSGASVVLIFLGSVNVLHHVLPRERQALGISLFVTSPPLGLAISQYATPRFLDVVGWRGATAAYLLLSLVGFAVFLGLFRESVTSDVRVTPGQFLLALRNRAVLLVSLASACTYAIWTYLNTWMPAYGTEVLGIDLAAAGAATALVPLAGILSRPSGGVLADRLGGRLRPVITLSFLAAGVLLYALSLASSATSFAVLLALTGGAVNLGVGLYLVYVNDLADPATRGTSLAVLLTSSQVGNLIAPVAGGWLIAVASWQAAFWFAIASAVLGTVVIRFVPPTTAMRTE